MSVEKPRLVFAPASGPGGSGEYYRCLALARAAADRCPDADIHFLLHRDAAVERDERFTYHALSATPARAGDEARKTLQAIGPDLVLFDNTGRVAQFRALRQAGAKVVYASNRPHRRLRGFRPRQMRQVDCHLIAEVGARPPRLKWYERGLMKLFPGCDVELVRGIVAEPDREALDRLADRLPPAGRPVAVFVAGGGGYVIDGRPVPDILVDAARRLSAARDIDCVVIMGPQYRGQLRDHPEIHLLESVPTRALGALLADARVTITGAGGMLSAQVLAAGRPAVMFPAGGRDQAERIRDLEAHGLILGGRADAQALADRAIRLLDSADDSESMARAQRALGIGEATPRVAERLLAMARSR